MCMPRCALLGAGARVDPLVLKVLGHVHAKMLPETLPMWLGC